jgi:hypothetical protein
MATALVGGVTAGSADVVLTQPFTYFKNMLQTGRTFRRNSQEVTISLNPRDWYRGSSAQVLNMVPTTMIQVISADVLKDLITYSSAVGDAARAMFGGIVSAPTASTTNLIVLHMQQKKKGIVDTVRYIYASAGYKGFMRGVGPIAAREAFWVLGYLSCYPRLSQGLSEVTGDLVSASFGSGIITGVSVAALTHPFDVIATRMQEDVDGRSAKSAIQTAQKIIKRHGSEGFTRGFVPRASSVVAGVLIVGTVAKKAQEVTSELI